jgi:NAD(P)-dependent dehydrogenase (short-subunit alcohol dehydrogenase family)
MDLKQLTQMYDFTGKTVVITGGAGILGGEIACTLVECGAKVAIVDLDPSLLSPTLWKRRLDKSLRHLDR